MISKNHPRKEGAQKITGRAKYIDDVELDDFLWGTTVRSTVARGRIKKIHFDPSVDWKEITIVTAKDIPGKNVVALIDEDQPFLADGYVNHPEEPIMLLAHPDRYVLEEARKKIRIDYQEDPALFTLEESLAKKTIIWGENNVFKKYLVEKGEIAKAFKEAEVVIEGEYFTGAQEQLYIENNGMLAFAAPDHGVTIWGSMQCPYYIHKAIKSLFGLEDKEVRVIQSETGGGFGGKEEYPSMIAGHAALLSLKSGRPVKIIYDRSEDMVATTKRHPSRTRHKTAFTREGKILGMDIEFVIDGGAYMTLSPVVLSRGTIHAAGPYNIEHVRIESLAVATNAPPHGAFRGFGAPQSIFALERHLDVAAKKLGLSPEQIRSINFLKQGDLTATGQLVKEDVQMKKLLDRALKESRYHEKKNLFAQENKNSSIKRGLGFATFMHGAGFTGSGERYLASVVGLRAKENGNIEVLASSTEIGQGTNTIFSQIVSEVLKIPFEMIDILQPDTAQVPNSGPTVASRTTMVVGKLVKDAAEALLAKLVASGFLKKNHYQAQDFQSAVQRYLKEFKSLTSHVQYQQPKDVFWDDQLYRGDAYATYAWAVYVAQVAVDTLSYETKVEDFVALQEVGKVIHPVLAAGQIEGGVAQGIGYSLFEKVVWKNGRMINNRMTNYIVPTAPDVPPIRVFFEESPSEHGPYGAKGIGELPMDGPGPAIVNAIQDALGGDLSRSLNFIPLLPEDLFEVLKP